MTVCVETFCRPNIQDIEGHGDRYTVILTAYLLNLKISKGCINLSTYEKKRLSVDTSKPKLYRNRLILLGPRSPNSLGSIIQSVETFNVIVSSSNYLI